MLALSDQFLYVYHTVLHSSMVYYDLHIYRKVLWVGKLLKPKRLALNALVIYLYVLVFLEYCDHIDVNPFIPGDLLDKCRLDLWYF